MLVYLLCYVYAYVCVFVVFLMLLIVCFMFIHFQQDNNTINKKSRPPRGGRGARTRGKIFVCLRKENNKIKYYVDLYVH